MAAQTPRLALVMIVRDEADCLPDCLEAASGIVDEMVIGDTGSRDATPAIARRFGARVLDVPWRGDFAEARNAVLAEARADWLLHLDADEWLDPENRQKVRALVDADGAGADALEVTLANYSNDSRAWRWTPAGPGNPWARGCAGYVETALLRLFRNGRGFEYREPVHENITESVLERGGSVRPAPILIHHYGYVRSADRVQAKRARYLALCQEKARLRPDDPKAWHDLAEQAFAVGETDTAENACRKALAHDPAHLAAATTLANILLNRGALDAARKALEPFAGPEAPAHVGAALGAIDYHQGRPEAAQNRLEEVVARAPQAVHGWLYLARAADALGQPGRARAHLEAAQAAAPALDEIRRRLEAVRLRDEGERAFARGDCRTALASFVGALNLDHEDPVGHNNAGVALAALGECGAARESFRRALMLLPDYAPARDNLRAIEQGGG